MNELISPSQLIKELIDICNLKAVELCLSEEQKIKFFYELIHYSFGAKAPIIKDDHDITL